LQPTFSRFFPGSILPPFGFLPAVLVEMISPARRLERGKIFHADKQVSNYRLLAIIFLFLSVYFGYGGGAPQEKG
jgi:hypothetical protein